MPTAKKASKKATNKTTKKAGPVELPPQDSRLHGTTVFSVRVDREKAVDLIGTHGFQVVNDMGDKVALIADEQAYLSYKESA